MRHDGHHTGRHVRIEAVADGVWAALHREGGWAIGNAGIVDLGDATLIFDALLTPDAFDEVAAAARALTGREPTYLALSHYHNDHVRGSERLPDTPLVASAATRHLLDTAGRDELAQDRQRAEARWRHAISWADDPDPERRRFATAFAPYWDALRRTAPHANVRLPNVTFDRELTLVGSRRSVRLTSLGAAHTRDDVAAILPDDGVVFCGDLLSIRTHPYLGDGDPDGWLRALTELGSLGAARFVPGHGPIGGSHDVAAFAEHLHALQALAERLVRGGADDATIAALLPEGDARDWDLAVPFHQANVRFLMARMRGRSG